MKRWLVFPAPLIFARDSRVSRPRARSLLVLSMLLLGGRIVRADCASNPVHIAPPFGTTLPGGTVGGSYVTTISATGGTAPYTFVAPLPAALPPGLALNAQTGAIAGSPTKAGTYTFEIDVRDKNGCEDSAIYRIVVTGSGGTCTKTIVLTPAGGALPAATLGESYDRQISASGGTPPYNFQVTAGDLSGSGISLESDGFFEGSATKAGTFNLQVTVTDAQGCSVTATFSLTVQQPAGCKAVLSEIGTDEERFASRALVSGRVTNTGDAPCTGTFAFGLHADSPFKITVAYTVTGSAIAMACAGSPSNQTCTGTGTIPPGQFAGAVGEILLTSIASADFPWTVTWNGASINGTQHVTVLPPRMAIGILPLTIRAITWTTGH
jgi:hypothetical protein